MLPEAVLNKDELKFLEENDGSIVKLSLSNLSAEKTRSNISKIEDKIEDQTDNVQEESIENENNSVRLAIRLTEVIGQIMKNKSGSFSKEILSDLFENSFDLNMRLISAFLTTVKSKEEEEKLIKFILSRLNKINEKKGILQKSFLNCLEIYILSLCFCYSRHIN
jgi:exopolyphosphatase/pppGpp-phosphohydrolase